MRRVQLIYVGERENDDVYFIDYQGEHRFVVRTGSNGALTVTEFGVATRLAADPSEP